MVQVPSNLIPTSVSQLPSSPAASADGLLLYTLNGVSYKIRAGDLLQVAGVPTTRQVIAGTSLQGGGPLSSNVTLSVAPGGIGTTQLANSGVTAGTYGSNTQVPVLTVDNTGRVVAASTAPFSVSGYVPESRQVLAGPGLTGGGALNSDVTLGANFSNSTPLPLGDTGSAGSALTLSRADHSHPAVDLADQTQVNGILPLDQGGTARSLVPNAGAVVWSGADGLYVGPAGVSGQVLVSGGAGAPTWGSALVVSPQAANSFFAGPTTGAAADPTFRALVNEDVPSTLSGKTLTSATVTNSTVNSTPIGASVPAEGTFTSLSANFLQLNTAAAAGIAVAKLRWNVDTATAAFGIIDGTQEVNIGQQMYAYVTNAEAVTITRGQAVYLYQATGNRASVKLALNTSDGTSAKTLGLAAQNIGAGQAGFVITQGVLDKVNTSSFSEGDTLYLGAAAGSLTTTKPTAPNHLVYVGVVERANAGNGQIYVKPQNGYELGEIHDVRITSEQNNDLLQYYSAGPYWRNVSPSAVSVGAATNLTAGTAGALPYQTGAGTTSFVSIGAAAQVLKVNPGATAPEWVSGAALSKVDDTNVTLTLGGSASVALLAATSLTLGWSGQLAVSRGGTGASTFAANGVLYGNSAAALQATAAGTTGQVLVGNTSAAPSWAAASSLSVGTATNAVNVGITDDAATSAVVYPVWVTTSTGNLPAKITSTKLTFNPSTGVLTATGGLCGGTF